MLNSSDVELLDVLQATCLIRKNFFGKKISLHVLKNAKSGACPENCSFCSQSKSVSTEVEEYPMESADEIVAGAPRRNGHAGSALLRDSNSRAPSESEMQTICEAAFFIRRIFLI
ncbi:Biotin synthase [Pontiella sulfatireligans]|uniref:Biotin synthase n=1 Tax=Pontiella sulfatireligans TaxID=2750658 RepID=A0A6C2UPC1_9BACT|nr:Biotin synthase [Pontiella sulfatireligans]